MSIIRSVANRIGIATDLFFDETEVARYVTIAETLSGVTVPDPGSGLSDHHFTHIAAPGLIDGSLPVLFFTTRHEGRLDFSVRLNSTILIRFTLEEGGVRTWHKLIPPGALKTEFNELVLAVRPPGGDGILDGQVTFADVFILYRSNELTVRRPPELSQT